MQKLSPIFKPFTAAGLISHFCAIFVFALIGSPIFAQGSNQLTATDAAITMPGRFSVAAVGDLIIRQPASQFDDEGLQAALEIIRNADLAVGNFEGSLSRTKEFEGPMRGFMGTHEVAPDIREMGFDLMNRANNHLLDSEYQGMFATNELLEEAGLVIAGAGQNLEEAAAPAYLELTNGRVSFVGMHTPNGVASGRLAASYRAGNLGGKPGLNMLNFSSQIVLTDDQIGMLRRIRDQLFYTAGNYDNPRSQPRNEPDNLLEFYSSASGREDPVFRVALPGEIPGTIDYEMNGRDLDRILQSIRAGKFYSDFAVATIHAHQSQSVIENFHLATRPPAFYVDLAHQAIDNGADIWVGHGVHTLRGVEIYNGKPIFYGLGEFFRQMNWSLEAQIGLRDVNPQERTGPTPQSLESLLTLSTYQDGALVEVLLYPIELRHQGPNSQLGIPRIAPPELGLPILQRVQSLSRELGTVIDIQDNVGVIRIM
ncbi:MAG: CapA family protein [Gammaproteobacteria bacterium]|jgi:poly-gamma-glutamate synthesis protein (capsule biosynthesis protein)|nr:CapA family protein [Gammaproteobacteria bacterium]